MNKWNEILVQAENWKLSNSKEDCIFANIIYYVCNSWYGMSENQKKGCVLICELIVILFTGICLYDLGCAFGKFLYELVSGTVNYL